MSEAGFALFDTGHRVVAAGGKPGGFSVRGGVALKPRLLAIEGVALDGGQLGLFAPPGGRRQRRSAFDPLTCGFPRS